LAAALERSPGSADLLIQKAWTEADLKRYEDASMTIRKGLECHPNHAILLSIQGEILYAQGQYEGARETLHRALVLSGENLRIEYGLGLVYTALGDFDKASHYFESSVKYDKSLVASRLLAMAERFLFEHRNRSS